MNNNWMVRKAYHFPGVSIIVPQQRETEISIVAHQLPDMDPDEYKNNPEIFTPKRIIGNFGLFTKADFDGNKFDEPFKTFDFPIEFRVRYTIEDLEQFRRNIYQLKLAYWDTIEWVIVSRDEYEYKIYPASTAMFAEFKIWSWRGDPTLAWGD